ncbi:MAG: helix-turn-helix transcriptional regulator [Anaerolineaceae bacterium]|nr:helix-turn-helix transcriptional regulator [Anaerolineaceae bacterium]
MTIGDNIRKKRKELGLSQRELASRIESDASYINRLETGKLNPSIASIEKIADVLHCSLDALVKGHNGDEDIHIQDKSLLERVRLIDAMDDEDKKAITHLIDALLTKKKIRELISEGSKT